MLLTSLHSLRYSVLLLQKKHGEDSEVEGSYIEALFGGELSSRVVCKECCHESINIEPFYDLSLPIPVAPSAADRCSLTSFCMYFIVLWGSVFTHARWARPKGAQHLLLLVAAMLRRERKNRQGKGQSAKVRPALRHRMTVQPQRSWQSCQQSRGRKPSKRSVELTPVSYLESFRAYRAV